jgi:hypothetical protein
MLLEVFMQRDVEAIGLVAVQAEHVISKEGGVLVVNKQIHTVIAHEEEGVLA